MHQCCALLSTHYYFSIHLLALLINNQSNVSVKNLKLEVNDLKPKTTYKRRHK